MTDPDPTVVLTVKRYIADQVVGIRVYVQGKMVDPDTETVPLLKCESV